MGHNDEHVYAIGRNAVVYYAPIGSVDLKELERTLADQKREREKFMGSWTEDTIIANGVAPPREFWKWLEEASLVKEVPKRGE
ncbi:MAG: hypothetical protein KDA66_13050 [Planctomycetaceae bacterium]|nr:hypothetical protein [Planctomycetaceae bacterium]